MVFPIAFETFSPLSFSLLLVLVLAAVVFAAAASVVATTFSSRLALFAVALVVLAEFVFDKGVDFAGYGIQLGKMLKERGDLSSTWILRFLELPGLLGVARAKILLSPDPIDPVAPRPPGTIHQVVVDGQLVIGIGHQLLLRLEVLLERVRAHVFKTHDPIPLAHGAALASCKLIL